MDKFPEAYARYEDSVDTSGLKTFNQLMNSFSSWGGKRWAGTPKQIKALGIEAKKKGFDTSRRKKVVYEEKEITYTTKTGKTVSYTRAGYIANKYYDIVTGQFVSRKKKQ